MRPAPAWRSVFANTDTVDPVVSTSSTIAMWGRDLGGLNARFAVAVKVVAGSLIRSERVSVRCDGPFLRRKAPVRIGMPNCCCNGLASQCD
jgi:hypothetical protein